MNFEPKNLTVRIFNSGALGSSQRQRDLLFYLLQKKSEGKSHEVTAYNIAVDVLGRSEDFNDSIDSIARTEMYRLRRNLDRFNAYNNDLKITIPNGQYGIEISKPRQSVKFFIIILISALIVPGFIFFNINESLNERTNRANLECSNTKPVLLYNNDRKSNETLYEKIMAQYLAETVSTFHVYKSFIEFLPTDRNCKGENIYQIHFEVSDDDVQELSKNSFPAELQVSVYHQESGDRIFYKPYNIYKKGIRWKVMQDLDLNIFSPSIGFIYEDLIHRSWENSDAQNINKLYYLSNEFLSFSDEEIAQLEANLLKQYNKTPASEIVLASLSGYYRTHYYFLGGETASLKRAEEYDQLISAANPNSYIFLITEIRKARSQNNKYKVEDMLENLKRLYPYNIEVFNEEVAFRTHILGHWDFVDEAIEKVEFESGIQGVQAIDYALTGRAMVNSDWELAANYVRYLTPSAISHIHEIAIFAELGNELRVKEIAAKLKYEFDLDLNQARQLLESREYHASIKTVLLNGLEMAETQLLTLEK